MLDITEMMYESLDALNNNNNNNNNNFSPPTTPTTPITPITPTTPMTPMTPITPMTPMTPISPFISIHYNPSKSIPLSSSNISHEIELIQPNDIRNRRHFKIIGDITATAASNIFPNNGHRNRHLSQISSSSTASSSDFSTLTINSTSPSPTLHDVDAYYLDDIDFEKLISFDNDDTDDTYDNNDFDVIINVGEGQYTKRFRSHSIILSKKSPYFRTAFSTKKHGNVYLFDKPNMSPKVFTAILRYLYFGCIKLERLDMSTILDLLIASNELILEDFTCEIQTYFIHLNSDWLKTKIVPILQCCYSNPSAFSKLLLHTLTTIKKDPTCLLIQNNLHLLSEQIMDNILNECYNGLDDWAIWQCIITWALGQENINEFTHDVKKWRQCEFIMLHELIFKLVEKYVRFSHISRNYFLDKVLPYLNYWIKDIGSVGSEVEEDVNDANKETVLYYLSNYQRYYTTHHHHIALHNNTYTNHHHHTSSSQTNIILEDSALINHTHALKIAYWIQEGIFIPNIIDTTNISSKSKKPNSYRFIFPFFRKKNRQQISTALSISTHVLTVTSTKSPTKAQFNHQQQQEQTEITSMSTPAAYQFNLLFRMSRDGASAYHDRCMNQGPTLVIAKIKLPSSSSNNRYILVGGYNPIGFNYFSNSIYENNSSALVFTFGDGKSFEKKNIIKMMINDDNRKEIYDCTKISKDCSKNFKSPSTKASLSMKKPLFSTKVNNISSISINNHNRIDSDPTGLCFGNNLIINFHDKFVEFNGGRDFDLIKSDLIECEIYQIKELCY